MAPKGKQRNSRGLFWGIRIGPVCDQGMIGKNCQARTRFRNGPTVDFRIFYGRILHLVFKTILNLQNDSGIGLPGQRQQFPST